MDRNSHAAIRIGCTDVSFIRRSPVFSRRGLNDKASECENKTRSNEEREAGGESALDDTQYILHCTFWFEVGDAFCLLSVSRMSLWHIATVGSVRNLDVLNYTSKPASFAKSYYQATAILQEEAFAVAHANRRSRSFPLHKRQQVVHLMPLDA